MLKQKRNIFFLILTTIVFYATGRLAYANFYRLTIDTIKCFANNQIGFFGKYPFLFFGDPTFGLLIGVIPLVIFLTHKLFFKDFRKSGTTFLIFTWWFLTGFLFSCYLESIQLTASNDFIKYDEVFIYGVRQVNLNQIFLLTIIVATVLTNFSLLITKRLKKSGFKQATKMLIFFC